MKIQHGVNSLPQNACAYARATYEVIPLFGRSEEGCECGNPHCERIGKHPRTKNGVRDATNNVEIVEEWWARWPNANIGVATGSTRFVLDVDGPAGIASLREHGVEISNFPKSAMVETGRGFHIYFSKPKDLIIRNSAGRLGPGLDIRGEGGYVVGHSSIHASGAKYRFMARPFSATAAPKWLTELLTKNEPPAGASSKFDGASAYAEAALADEVRAVRQAAEFHRNDTLNPSAFKIGQLMETAGLDEARVVSELLIAATAAGLDRPEATATIMSGIKAGRETPRSVPAASEALSHPSEPASEDPHAETLAAYGLTDADNAQRLYERYGEKLLWTPGSGWFVYDGRFWRPDDMLQGLQLAEESARKIKNEASFCEEKSERLKFARASLSKGAIDRAVELVKSRCAKSDSDLDADPWKLCVRNGTLNLKTGELGPHRQEDLITKIINIDYNPSATSPNFDGFLAQVFRGDGDLMEFMNKAVGMSLTGDVSEQKFFLCFGPGGTGKSTFLSLIRAMLGNYGQHSDMELWLAKKHQPSIQTGLARLRGMRMVTAIEANFDQRLDEARIKVITGGEPIVARPLYRNEIEFQPQCKLWFAVNDLPQARETSAALWRRAQVIPFKAQIGEDQVNRELLTILQRELPGILAWAVQGCLKWQRDGLKAPRAVEEATGVWKKKSNHLSAFIRDRIIRDEGNNARAQFVFDSYQTWCEAHGEKALSIKSFKALMTDAGFEHEQKREGARWSGVKLRHDE